MKSSQADDDPIETNEPERLTAFVFPHEEVVLELHSGIKFEKHTWGELFKAEVARGKSSNHQPRRIIREVIKGKETGRIALGRGG